MKLYIDTEFNGFGGELISMAIAAEDGKEWYGVLTVPSKQNAWVSQHVIPFLAIENYTGLPMGVSGFVNSFERFIIQYNGAEVIADWPADLEHFCYMMTYAGEKAGFRIPIECTMQLIRSGNLEPEIPHNALSDARALRDWHLKRGN